MNIALGIFIILHSLVHLLYFGQSGRYFELSAGMTWPDGAWAFAAFLSDEAVRTLASVACVIAAVGFAAGGVGMVVEQDWWRPVVIAFAVFSIVAFVLFWDGSARHLADQGGVNLLINAAILVALLVFNWPELNF